MLMSRDLLQEQVMVLPLLLLVFSSAVLSVDSSVDLSASESSAPLHFDDDSLSTTAKCQGYPTPCAAAKGPAAYDFLLLSQQYLPEFCYNLNVNGIDSTLSHNKGTKCKYVPQEMSVHGLWPNNAAPPFPSCCKLDPLAPSFNVSMHLKQLWQDPTCDIANDECYRCGLYDHEWIKHGTCQDLSSENFFEKVLEITAMLANATEYLNQHAGEERVLKVDIEALYPNKIQLMCSTTSPNNVLEVHTCWDKSFRMIDCPEAQAFGPLTPCNEETVTLRKYVLNQDSQLARTNHCDDIKNNTVCTNTAGCDWCYGGFDRVSGNCIDSTKSTCCTEGQDDCAAFACSKDETCVLPSDACMFAGVPSCCKAGTNGCVSKQGASCCDDASQACCTSAFYSACCDKDAVCCSDPNVDPRNASPWCCPSGSQCCYPHDGKGCDQGCQPAHQSTLSITALQ